MSRCLALAERPDLRLIPRGMQCRSFRCVVEGESASRSARRSCHRAQVSRGDRSSPESSGVPRVVRSCAPEFLDFLGPPPRAHGVVGRLEGVMASPAWVVPAQAIATGVTGGAGEAGELVKATGTRDRQRRTTVTGADPLSCQRPERHPGLGC